MEKLIIELLGSTPESRTMENDKRIFDIFLKADNSELKKEDFQLLEKQLIENKKKLFFIFSLAYGNCPDKINITPNSSNFDLLRNNFNSFKQMYPDVEIGCQSMPSIVQINNRIVVTLHNTITITLPSGSYLSISSMNDESIEITYIRVETVNHSRGEGTLLMNTIVDFMTTTLGYRPRIVLECNGSLGSGSERIQIGIQKQTAFFEKFGFRVKSYKHYPRYVMMISNKSVENQIEQPFQLAA